MKARAAAVALAISAAALPAAAEVYQWTDRAGKIHFTGDLSQVPHDQRATAGRPSASGRGSLQQVIERDADAAAPARRPGAGRAGAAPAAQAPQEERFGGKTEAQWRATAQKYRDAIARLEEPARRCEGDSFRWTRGAGRRAYREEVAEADGCRRVQNELDRNRRRLETLEAKAHKAGAPPGWLRE